MKLLILTLTIIGVCNLAHATGANDDLLLPIKSDRFYVHPKVADTLVYVALEGEGVEAFRFKAVLESDKMYIANLKQNTPYACTFGTQASKCERVVGAVGCQTGNNFQVASISCNETP